MIFKNEYDLKEFILPKLNDAVVEVEKEVYDKLESNRNAFYAEDWETRVYHRTDALKDSLKRTGVHGAYAEVYFDTPSYNTGSWSGEKVLSFAMEDKKPHGGYMTGTQIWTASINELGDIEDKLIQALRMQGIFVKKG